MIRVEVGADGSITKSGSQNPKTKAVADVKYQLSEVRLYTSLPYAGSLRPIDDVHGGTVWWPR